MKCDLCFRFFLLPVILFCALSPHTLFAQVSQPDTFTIYFSFNNYSISKNQSIQLNSFLHKHIPADTEAVTITIVGYTDTVGTEKYNTALSMRRCQSVNSALQQITVNRNYKAQLIPMGETNAPAQTDSVNRRAEIIFYSRSNHTVQAVVPQPGSTVIKEKEKREQLRISVNDKIVDTIIVMDNIYFEPDLAVLTHASTVSLPQYINILKKYKDNNMEVGGHVNYNYSILEDTDPLFKLSEQRAKLVYQYLVDNGFDAARLTHKGYGNLRMVFPVPANTEEKMKNMRVEITVFKSP
jgi:outer membrane protein OmpA-like peptidoglycan-associated protein